MRFDRLKAKRVFFCALKVVYYETVFRL